METFTVTEQQMEQLESCFSEKDLLRFAGVGWTRNERNYFAFLNDLLQRKRRAEEDHPEKSYGYRVPQNGKIVVVAQVSRKSHSRDNSPSQGDTEAKERLLRDYQAQIQEEKKIHDEKQNQLALEDEARRRRLHEDNVRFLAENENEKPPTPTQERMDDDDDDVEDFYQGNPAVQEQPEQPLDFGYRMMEDDGQEGGSEKPKFTSIDLGNVPEAKKTLDKEYDPEEEIYMIKKMKAAALEKRARKMETEGHNHKGKK